ncbi:MAG: cupin domain-containing protein [Patescibacteria group bacterium]
MKNLEIVIKKNDLDKFINSLPETGPYGEKMLANSQETVIVSKNITGQEPAPKAEMHENYVDIFLVTEGKEELFIGGELKDKESVSSGEWLGMNLVGARKYNIEAGDIIIIPKGVPHQHGKGVIRLAVIKTR